MTAKILRNLNARKLEQNRIALLNEKLKFSAKLVLKFTNN